MAGDRDSLHLGGRHISPDPIHGGETAAQLVDRTFLAYNAARLREACRLLNEKMLEPDVTVGMSLTGALTPAGLGMAALVPLVEQGFVDWVVSTGANLYHDAHFGLGLSMKQGRPDVSDVDLREDGVVRIYDVFFDYDVLLSTDAFFRKVIRQDEFQGTMSSSEFHHLLGGFLARREQALGLEGKSFLAACHAADVPVYTPSPGDSSIGMNLAATRLQGGGCRIDPSRDVNETAALVLAAKRRGRSAAVILGGGSPKNFLLQTEPHIQEVLGIEEKGHDYFLQVTDARPDTGGLSGATPGEAVSWGKVDPEGLPDAVVCYTDITIALPLLAHYVRARHDARPLRRLYRRREEMVEELRRAHRESGGRPDAPVHRSTLDRRR